MKRVVGNYQEGKGGSVEIGNGGSVTIKGVMESSKEPLNNRVSWKLRVGLINGTPK